MFSISQKTVCVNVSKNILILNNILHIDINWIIDDYNRNESISLRDNQIYLYNFALLFISRF